MYTGSYAHAITFLIGNGATILKRPDLLTQAQNACSYIQGMGYIPSRNSPGAGTSLVPQIMLSSPEHVARPAFALTIILLIPLLRAGRRRCQPLLAVLLAPVL